METRNIEIFFLNTLLKVSLAGVATILLVDVMIFPEDRISITIDVVILSAASLAYFLRKKHPNASIFIVTMTVLCAMFLQCLIVPTNTTTSLSIILVVGFIFSVMLKGRMMWVMHTITFCLIHTIFIMQFLDPSKRFSPKLADVVTVAITYSILYFILTYATAVLKAAYDRLYVNLSSLNAHLEEMVRERTERIQMQNEALIRYSYTNAHHLRGPVARLLGLATISRMDAGISGQEIISRMEQQAMEIDKVIKQINDDLEMKDYVPRKVAGGEVPVA